MPKPNKASFRKFRVRFTAQGFVDVVAKDEAAALEAGRALTSKAQLKVPSGVLTIDHLHYLEPDVNR